MVLPKAILRMLGDKVQCDVTTPDGASRLQADIMSATGERLSVNTLKRLTGVIDYDNAPRPSTLSIIALYLGYSSWQLLTDSIAGTISGFDDETPGVIQASALAVGTRLTVGWEPDRLIVIRHRGGGIYEVESAANSKLAAGDELQLTQLADGFPLLVSEVKRGGLRLGEYSAARVSGITVSMISNDDEPV